MGAVAAPGSSGGGGGATKPTPHPPCLHLPTVLPSHFAAWQSWVADKGLVEERLGLSAAERAAWIEEMVGAWLFGNRYGMREFQDALMRGLRREGRRLRGVWVGEAVVAAAAEDDDEDDEDDRNDEDGDGDEDEDEDEDEEGGMRERGVGIGSGPFGEGLLEEVWAGTQRMGALRLFLVYLAAECCFPAEAPAAWFAGVWMVEGFWEEWEKGLELFGADVAERRECGVGEWDYVELDERTKRDFYVKEAGDVETAGSGRVLRSM
ncbi:hypothetical protein AOQ84DRAFT_372309 [Glonium stellatum]|uniref:Uncharacterized protein n=1 Tax=Glonium stellatum TaxID=574774 RepID=A0A8E2F9V6_9PEZI|nr:hypothetical protein AOQ84DRAFT_372309 [Glonium stellatum]